MKRLFVVCVQRCVLSVMVLLGSALAHADPTCHGKFANLITDICWSCMFPMTLGSSTMASYGQEDNGSDPGTFLCGCPNPPRAGVAVGFWEPIRMVDVVRSPFCLVGLGGVSMDPGVDAPRGGQAIGQDATLSSFYQVHWYTNPVLYYMEVLLDDPCLEKGTLDVVYLTEVDPLWNDDELAAVLNPESVLFANPISQAVCAADCVAASIGFGVDSLFWCAGCQGGIYPMNGNVRIHAGGINASALLVQRMAAKMHRQLITWAGDGAPGLCGMRFQPIMAKSQYKMQMLYPTPNTAKENGRCCQPFGRQTFIWGSGKEYPVDGEDFSYMLFRKRNCCETY